MRLGMLARADELEFVQRMGFRCFQWVRFAESGCGPAHIEWRAAADAVREESTRRGLRISAIGAWYRNALDPKQTDEARANMQRAIVVASHLGVRTVSAFAGADIKTHWNERGGNPIYHDMAESIPAAVDFWRPLAQEAEHAGVRLAFEHCPQGAHHLPVMHYNMLGQPALWNPFFDALGCRNAGLEWDAAHLVCQLIDPVENIRQFRARIFHVHAKDASINRPLLARHGICHPGVAEHRFPGLGDSNWAQIITELIRCGYDSDLNIEGWHDPVYRESLEEAGLQIARRTLEPLVAGTE